MSNELLKIYQTEEGDLNFNHPEITRASMLAIIGYMEIVKKELIEEIQKKE